MKLNRLFFHPVFNLQTRDTAEVFDVIGNQNQVVFHGSSSNKKVKTVNRRSSLFRFKAYFSIFVKARRNLVVLKQTLHRPNIIEMFFFTGLNRSKKHFCNGNFRNLQVLMIVLTNVLTNIRMAFHHSNANVGVKQIFTFCKHGYQTSTLRLFTRPFLRDSAISVAEPSPPQSEWKLAKTSSYKAWFSSSHADSGTDKSCVAFSAFASSRSTCSDICSTSHFLSRLLRLLSIVKIASVGIVLTIVFILYTF